MSHFRRYAFFDTPEEFEEFFELATLFCPVDKIQYWRGEGCPGLARDSSDRKNCGRKMALSPIDQLLFTFIQARAVPHNNTCCDLFDISEGTGTCYFTTWIRLLEELLLHICPVDKELHATLAAGIPAPFSELFGSREVLQILDCLHWDVDAASDEYARKVLFNAYWGGCVGKALIPLSCLGGYLPCSPVYPGKITDPQIVEAWLETVFGPKPETVGKFSAAEFAEQGVLFANTYGLADKGWVDSIRPLLERGFMFITPDKKRTGSDQFTEDDSVWNADVAHLRIHVERAIKHIREWRILNTRMPLLRKDLMSSILMVINLLQNFRPPVGGTDFGFPAGVCAHDLMWGDR